MNNLGALLRVQGKYDDADSILREALKIKRRTLGDNHPSIPSTLNNLGILYEVQGKFEEAEQFYRDGLEILQSTVGDEHPNTQHVKRSLESLLSKLKEAETPPAEDSDR